MAQAKQAKNEHPVSDKVKDTLHDSVDALAAKAASTEEALRETATNSAQNISDTQEKVKERWEQSPVKKYATENPIATAGIAFAAGMLLSSLLRKR